MSVRVQDLTDQTGNAEPHPILFCECCGGEYSANRSDYSFQYPDVHVFECCDEPMTLVTKQIVYRKVR